MKATTQDTNIHDISKITSRQGLSQILKNAYKGWFTTSIGIIILSAAIYSVTVQTHEWSDAAWGIGIGLGLIFCPDDILKRLRNLIKK